MPLLGLPLPWYLWLAIAVGLWLGWAWAANWLLDNPRDDAGVGLIVWRPLRLYARLVHRLAVVGRANIPPRTAGPLIVVANHSAGVDPILLQAACPFEIRWMMAQDMRVRALEPVWSFTRTIFVDRARGDSAAAREAIRHLQSGGVLGIFPEGGIARPAGQLHPFIPGVGLIVSRTGALVLPVVIEGTPQIDPAWASLWRPSRSRVCVYPVIDYRGSGLSAAQIAADLRTRFLQWTGWRDEPRPPPGVGTTRP